MNTYTIKKVVDLNLQIVMAGNSPEDGSTYVVFGPFREGNKCPTFAKGDPRLLANVPWNGADMVEETKRQIVEYFAKHGLLARTGDGCIVPVIEASAK
jgi:hypothetical protein